MKKIILFITITFSFYSLLYSQKILDLSVYRDFKGWIDLNPTSLRVIEGSPFFNDNWLKSNLKLANNEYLIDSLKYDIYSENLLFKYKGIEYYISDKKDLVSFTIDNSKFIQFASSNDNTKSFFEILNDDNKLLLVKKHKCNIIEGKKSDGILPEVKDKYRLTYDYYTILNNTTAQFFKNKKSNLLKLMSDHKDEIEKYINENNLKMKNEEDLIKVFKYYNTFN